MSGKTGKTEEPKMPGAVVSYVSQLNLSNDGVNYSQILCDINNQFVVNTTLTAVDFVCESGSLKDLWTKEAADFAQINKNLKDYMDSSVAAAVAQEASDVASLTASVAAAVAQEASDVASLTASVAAAVAQEASDVAALTASVAAAVAQEASDVAALTASVAAAVAQEVSDVAAVNAAVALKADESEVVQRCNDLCLSISDLANKEQGDIDGINAALLNAEQSAAASFADLQSKIDAINAKLSGLGGSYSSLTGALF